MRNWTESIGNSIFFAGLDSVDYIEWLSDRPRRPPPLISAFLHEFTHHWCFNSLVGNALAFTELRVHAVSGRVPRCRPLCARDHLALTCLSALMRPIAEGMALFAEFDLGVSGLELKLGTPMTATELCFAQEGPAMSQAMLNALRRDGGEVDRKASSVYLADFEIREGYLPGYVLIKSLYGSMQLRAPGLNPELFLAYVRCFLWEDPFYMDLLAQTDQDGPGAARRLCDHFLQRIDILRLSGDLADRMEAFWRDWSAKGQFAPGWSIHVDPDASEVTLARFVSTTEAVLQLIVSDECDETGRQCAAEEICHLHAKLANLRRFTIIARTPARVEHVEDGWTLLLLRPDGTASALNRPGTRGPPAGDCECLVVMPCFAEYLVIALKYGDAAIIVSYAGPFDSDLHAADILEFLNSIDIASDAIILLRKDFEVIGYPAINSPAMRAALDGVDAFVFELYLGLVTLRGPASPDQLEHERRLLCIDGLRSVFADQPLALRAVAALSLAEEASHSIHGFDLKLQARLVETFWLQDEKPGAVLQALQDVARRDLTGLVTAVDGALFRVIL